VVAGRGGGRGEGGSGWRGGTGVGGGDRIWVRFRDKSRLA
jgi:hypothetical protein